MKCDVCGQESDSLIGGRGEKICEWCNAVSVREMENAKDRRTCEGRRWYDMNRRSVMIGWSLVSGLTFGWGFFLGWLFRGYCG